MVGDGVVALKKTWFVSDYFAVTCYRGDVSFVGSSCFARWRRLLVCNRYLDRDQYRDLDLDRDRYRDLDLDR